MRPIKRASARCAVLFALTPTVWATEVSVCTDSGPVTIELFDEQAPLHTANFLRYVEQGFYSGTVFHRVVDGFVVQGGGYDRQLRQRETFEPIQNESRNGLSNVRGTVAAARSEDPHSATSQFFVNLKDNTQLDGSEDEWGYTVFGRVTAGIEVLDAISELPTSGKGALPAEVPEPLAAVSSMAVLDRAALAEIPEDTRAAFIQQAISDAAALNDADRTLEWVRLFRAICAPPDSYVLLIEANAAVARSDVQRAAHVLDEYFAITDRSHPSFSTAETLSRNLAPSAPAGAEALLSHCEIPSTPDIPNGSLDALERMVEGQAAVRDFMAESETYLDCLSEVIDDRNVTDAQHANAVQRHNQMVSLMEQLAERFNEQVRVFKAREN
jgi:cyclophilin family peptidyl-prolyl cis-trans isomerase